MTWTLHSAWRATAPYRVRIGLALKGIGYDRYTLIEVGKAYDPEAGQKFLADYKATWTELANG